MNTEGVDMIFLASSMYCKFVIDVLNSGIEKLKLKNENYDILEDKLYESYVQLEKILNAEFH